MKLSFRISLQSDFHVGSGGSGIFVDSALLRDADGVYVIRGTILNGLLRQGMWQLLQTNTLSHYKSCKASGYTDGPDDCSYSAKKCPICQILGTKTEQKSWKISSARPKYAQEMTSRDQSLFLKSNIVWRNRVDPITKTAEEKKLFNMEVGSKETEFIFTIENENDSERTLKEAAFIVAALRMIRFFGASRRRGKGYCTIHLEDITPKVKIDGDMTIESYFLDLFKKLWLNNEPIQKIEFLNKKKSESVEKIDSPWYIVVLRTDEPLVIANKYESGNRYQSVPYIPGTTFLGALAWHISKKMDLKNPEEYAKFVKLFRRDGIQITPLYPALYEDVLVYPSIPSPLDLFTCKLYRGFIDKHDTIPYALKEEHPEICKICKKNDLETPLTQLRKYVALRRDMQVVNVSFREEMHIEIDKLTGKAKPRILYEYKAIEAGQYFIGMMKINDFASFSQMYNLERCVDGYYFEMRLGKASTKGYGKVRVWIKPTSNANDIFIRKSIEERITNVKEPIVMTLLTDTILLDDWGRYYGTFTENLLNNIFGFDISIMKTYVSTKTISGFNMYLGLPKHDDIAISAGSCVSFSINNTVSRDAIIEILKKLELEGIGIRRQEGFGRVVFNHPIHTEMDDDYIIEIPEKMQLRKSIAISNISEEISVIRLWKDHVETTLTPNAFKNDFWIDIARFLKTNVNKKFKNRTEVLALLNNNPLKAMIKEKKPQRTKKKFFDSGGDGYSGYKEINEILNKLDELLRASKLPKESVIRVYKEAIQYLADFIMILHESVKEE